MSFFVTPIFHPYCFVSEKVVLFNQDNSLSNTLSYRYTMLPILPMCHVMNTVPTVLTVEMNRPCHRKIAISPHQQQEVHCIIYLTYSNLTVGVQGWLSDSE